LGFARKYSLRTLGIAGDREGREVRTEIEHMREALASYIEATYHLFHIVGLDDRGAVPCRDERSDLL
jgi:hypothetical protein